MTESLKASVIIPTHNRKRILSYVLRYYASQKGVEDRFELLVVDDGSNDDTCVLFDQIKEIDHNHLKGMLKKYYDRIVSAKSGCYKTNLSVKGDTPLVKYIKIKKSGRSIARNIGIALSSFPLIIFADDDIFVEPEFVRRHLEAHSFDDKRIVMGRVIHTRNLENPFSARWKLKDINTAFLATGNASVLKSHIIQAGLFDEEYTVYGWEDFDLGIHLKEKGLVSEKRGIYGYHYDPPMRSLEPDKIYRKEKERGFSAVYFFENHPLKWVRRFTLVDTRLLQSVFQLLGRGNWFLSIKKISIFKGLFKLIIRYKGYFDGVREGKDYSQKN